LQNAKCKLQKVKLIRAMNFIETDVLVIGGGGAGAMATLHAHNQGAKALMVVKGKFGRTGGTTCAMGAATAVGPWHEPQEVYDTVKRKMWKNVGIVLEESKRSKRLPREVALAISQERVRKAMELRGRFPKKR
jgi:succinate dehydrogenase/fumarate reductase flavoprotein subunit